MLKRICKAAHVANFILNRADAEERDISILKLLKLVYIFFGWTSAFHPDRPALFSDRIEAWKYGPVIPSLYYELRRFGRKPIKGGRALVYNPSTDASPRVAPESEIDDKEVLKTLELIWNSYKDAPADHIVALTHQEDTPWRQVYDENAYGKEIPKDVIRSYYKNLYERFAAN